MFSHSDVLKTFELLPMLNYFSVIYYSKFYGLRRWKEAFSICRKRISFLPHFISEIPESLLLLSQNLISLYCWVTWSLGVFGLFVCFFLLFILGNDEFTDAEWRAEIHDPTGVKTDKAKQSYHSVRKHH